MLVSCILCRRSYVVCCIGGVNVNWCYIRTYTVCIVKKFIRIKDNNTRTSVSTPMLYKETYKVEQTNKDIHRKVTMEDSYYIK